MTDPRGSSGVARLTNGVMFERKVATCLTVRGYQVEPFGTGLLTARAKHWLRGPSPQVAWMPDLLVHHNGAVWQVDAKWTDRVDTGRHDVNESAAHGAAVWETFSGMPLWFVFRDGRCATPSDVLSIGFPGRVTANGSGLPFLLIRADACRHIDTVFPPIPKG